MAEHLSHTEDRYTTFLCFRDVSQALRWPAAFWMLALLWPTGQSPNDCPTNIPNIRVTEATIGFQKPSEYTSLPNHRIKKKKEVGKGDKVKARGLLEEAYAIQVVAAFC